jgi:hypothetical protein
MKDISERNLNPFGEERNRSITSRPCVASVIVRIIEVV